MAGAGAGGQLVDQHFRVELAVAPGNFPVIDRFVEDAEIVEGDKKPTIDAGKQIAFENQVVIAQRQDVGLIATVRRRRQAEQEARREVLQQAPVHRRGGVVEFIDDNVIEVRR